MGLSKSDRKSPWNGHCRSFPSCQAFLLVMFVFMSHFWLQRTVRCQLKTCWFVVSNIRSYSQLQHIRQHWNYVKRCIDPCLSVVYRLDSLRQFGRESKSVQWILDIVLLFESPYSGFLSSPPKIVVVYHISNRKSLAYVDLMPIHDSLRRFEFL